MLNKAVFGSRERPFQADAARTNPAPPPPASDAPVPGGGTSASAATRNPAHGATNEPSGSRLIVGPHIRLKGVEITDCDTLVVEGRVEAAMDSRVIQVAEGGAFTGTVSIDVAEIRGRFEGEITARERLTIYSSGRVTGKVRYGRLVIEDGGELAGDVSRLIEDRGNRRAGEGIALATLAPAPSVGAAIVTGSS